MLNTSLLSKIRKDLLTYAEIRQRIIKDSNDALFQAKRAIFSIHRDQMSEAKEKLGTSRALLVKISKEYGKDSRALDEGAYKAALEEFVEAELFYQFVVTHKIGEVKGIKVSSESYIAGLTDVPGELYRFAIKAATARDEKTVRACADAADEIIGELIECNLTSYLRNKFDQAKTAVHKLEHVVYELSLRK
jgi:translin